VAAKSRHTFLLDSPGFPQASMHTVRALIPVVQTLEAVAEN